MDSLAITDHGVMYGVIEFYEAAKKAGIKPVLGCEVYVAPGQGLIKAQDRVRINIITLYYWQRITPDIRIL